jgi:hypothetical protein
MVEARLSISVALTRYVVSSGREVPSIVDDLLEKAFPASPAMDEELEYPLAEEVLNALPQDRRFKLIASGNFPKWKLYRLVPPHAVLDHALRQLYRPNDGSSEFFRWAAAKDLQCVISGLSKGPVQHWELLASILMDLQTEKSVATLLDLLEDSSRKVRRAAITSLHEMPKSLMSDGIERSLNSRYKYCREAAKTLL